MYKKVAGELVLEMGVQKCSSVAGSLDDPSTGVSHGGYDIPSQNSCGYEAGGSMSATSARCLSSGEFVSKAQIASSSCSQMLGFDTLTQLA